jgi:hypothetical protein
LKFNVFHHSIVKFGKKKGVVGRECSRQGERRDE